MTIRSSRLFITAVLGIIITGITGAAPASAQDRLCDPANESCRSILINLIRNETVGIDVAFWFMEDARYTAELISRHRAGVPVRVLIDPRANSSYPLNAQRLQELQAGGIPMRRRTSQYILHWKMMLFHGQNMVEFSGANYSADAWITLSALPYENYVDEAIYFTSDTPIVDSFRTRFDDEWVDNTNWANYANVSGLARRYGTFPQDPSLNFPPTENFRTRSIASYNAETYWIDVIMYRITDRQHTDAILAAKARGVGVRLITEPEQYRDPTRLWHAWNVDRLYMGGVEIKHRAHLGLAHQKSVILYGQGAVIFGSSNWTSPSAAGQLEHNMFTTKPYISGWFVDQFRRKWGNTTGVAESMEFTPLPPNSPTTPSPAHQSTGVATAATLQWYGGPWAHLYDIYLDTNPNPTTRIASNLELGPSESATEMQSHFVSAPLNPYTTYYWRVVGKTMALQEKWSPVWSFTTGEQLGSPPPSAATLVSPVSGSTSATPTFTWNAVSKSTFYFLWINDSTGTRHEAWYERSTVGCASGTGRCAVTPVVPLTPGPIQWGVLTWNAAGLGAWSAAGSFTLKALAKPTLIAPNGSLPAWPAIQFRWNRVPGATYHLLWVTDAAGVDRVQTWYDLASSGCASSTICSVTLSPPMASGTATWWILAGNFTTGYSPLSTGYKFVVP